LGEYGLTKKPFFLVLPILLIVAVLAPAFQLAGVRGELDSSSNADTASLLDFEQQVVSSVNGSRAYDYDLELENIAYSHPDFRSSGSSGAFEAANWIKGKLESFGLQSWLEPFQFTNWTLLDNASLVIDEDGNSNTVGDQTSIDSFQCEHLSWPTPIDGVFADLVVLPLPVLSDRSQIGTIPINMTLWDSINTTGKIVLVGREVRSHPNSYANKLRLQPPAAVVYTWWYIWDSFIPPFFSSSGGVPMNEGYYWNLSIPVGFVDYDDGLLIKDSKNTNPSLAANVTIPSVINSSGTHYNVVGKINGFQDPDKLVIISGHYDTVMCSGFCDNGAGTAGIVELAKVFSEAVQSGVYQPNHTLLFVGFAGEELYLVGSASYIKQHKNDMANITAVINLDCIGSDDLYVSQTPDSGLAQTIIQAAQDLNVSIAVESPGGSDHESFRSPSDVNYMIQLNWGVDLGISDAAPVAASAMLDSYPLFYNDLWNMGAPGWIHTSYDNSTSTSTLNWVEKDDLENHIRVAVLSVMRSSPNFVPEFPPGIALVLLMSVTLTVCVLVRKVRGSRIERSARASTSNLRRKILKGVWARSARASVLLNSGN
jgi:hypothetical protein